MITVHDQAAKNQFEIDFFFINILPVYPETTNAAKTISCHFLYPQKEPQFEYAKKKKDFDRTVRMDPSLFSLHKL